MGLNIGQSDKVLAPCVEGPANGCQSLLRGGQVWMPKRKWLYVFVQEGTQALSGPLQLQM